MAGFRTLRHFLQGSHPISGAALYRLEELGSKERAEQRERALIKEYMRSHDDMPQNTTRD